MKGGEVKLTPLPGKTTLKKSSLISVNKETRLTTEISNNKQLRKVQKVTNQLGDMLKTFLPFVLYPYVFLFRMSFFTKSATGGVLLKRYF